MLIKRILASLAIFVCAVSANAQIASFCFSDWTSNTQIVVIGGKQYYAGLYEGTLNNDPYRFYCTDFTHLMGAREYDVMIGHLYGPTKTLAQKFDNGQYYYMQGNHGASLMSAFGEHDYNVNKNGIDYETRAKIVSQLSRGINTPNLNSKDHAARQLAIWNIIQDGDFDVSTINGESTMGTDPYILQLANQYLALKDDNGWHNNVLWVQAGGTDMWRSNHSQDMITLNGAPPVRTFVAMSCMFGMFVATLQHTLQSKKDKEFALDNKEQNG